MTFVPIRLVKTDAYVRHKVKKWVGKSCNTLSNTIEMFLGALGEEWPGWRLVEGKCAFLMLEHKYAWIFGNDFFTNKKRYYKADYTLLIEHDMTIDYLLNDMILLSITYWMTWYGYRLLIERHDTAIDYLLNDIIWLSITYWTTLSDYRLLIDVS